MLRLVFVVLSALVLASCSGAGKTDRASHATEINSAETRVFVLRSTGFANAANLVNVTLNGQKIGGIGNNESISLPVSPGAKTLAVNMGGLGSLTTSKVQRQFTLKPGDKKFFVINQDAGAFGATLKLYEVSSSEFLRS